MAFFAISIIASVAQKSTCEGATGINTKLDASIEDWTKAIFFRENIRGFQKETWHHLNGCRMWLEVERSTLTHEIKSIKPCHPDLQKLMDSKK